MREEGEEGWYKRAGKNILIRTIESIWQSLLMKNLTQMAINGVLRAVREFR